MLVELVVLRVDRVAEPLEMVAEVKRAFDMVVVARVEVPVVLRLVVLRFVE